MISFFFTCFKHKRLMCCRSITNSVPLLNASSQPKMSADILSEDIEPAENVRRGGIMKEMNEEQKKRRRKLVHICLCYPDTAEHLSVLCCLMMHRGQVLTAARLPL